MKTLAKLSFSLLLLFVALVLNSGFAQAGSNLDCVANSKGMKLKWNSAWVKDNSDNNTEYTVTGVTEVDKIPLREVTLELRATGAASRTSRTLVIDVEERARAVCERLFSETPPLRAFRSTDNIKYEELPFIRFTKDGWLRDDFDNSSELAVCQVGKLKFACPKQDRERYFFTLKTLETQLTILSGKSN